MKKIKKPSSFSKAMFGIIVPIVRFFFGKNDIEGIEKIPKTDAIIVANHCQMAGPLVAELYMPKHIYTWCAGDMMTLSSVPSYAFSDFWSQKPRWTHPLYRILSYTIAPLAVCLFNNARTIAVHRDTRVLGTFKKTIKFLEEGKNILIFPEKDEKYNNIIYTFQENYIDLAKLYYKKTGRAIHFVPLYIAPTMRKSFVGESTAFNPEADFAEEKKRINTYLTNEITSIARALPEHIVVPYRNMPKKYYITNKETCEVPNEKARL